MAEIDPLDLTQLDNVAASEKPFEFQVKDAAGNPMNFWLSVIGDNAERVQKFAARKINDKRRNDAIRAARRGKADEFEPIESDIDMVNEGCALRIVGWRGAKQEYSHALAKTLVARNPHIREQVLEQSGNIATFTQG